MHCKENKSALHHTQRAHTERVNAIMDKIGSSSVLSKYTYNKVVFFFSLLICLLVFFCLSVFIIVVNTFCVSLHPPQLNWLFPSKRSIFWTIVCLSAEVFCHSPTFLIHLVPAYTKDCLEFGGPPLSVLQFSWNTNICYLCGNSNTKRRCPNLSFNV